MLHKTCPILSISNSLSDSMGCNDKTVLCLENECAWRQNGCGHVNHNESHKDNDDIKEIDGIRKGDFVTVNKECCYFNYSQFIEQHLQYAVRWAYKCFPNEEHKFVVMGIYNHVLNDIYSKKYDSSDYCVVVQDCTNKQIFLVGNKGIAHYIKDEESEDNEARKIDLLQKENEKLREQVRWAVGDINGNCCFCRKQNNCAHSVGGHRACFEWQISKRIASCGGIKMSKFIGNVFVIEKEEDNVCEYCGSVKETRPYGRNGARICYSCAMSQDNKEETERNFNLTIMSAPKSHNELN